jgi:hypothetical protein
MSHNVTELNSYREAKDDKALDRRMDEAQEVLGELIENVSFDGTTLYFVWRNLNDVLLGIEWDADMLRSGLDFDIRNFENNKEEDDEAPTTE